LLLHQDALAVAPSAARGVAARRYQNDDVLGAYTGPVLQIHGEQDRLRLPRATTRRESVLRDGTTEIWQDAGHASFLDDPGRFNETLARFLGAIDQLH
jgi:non-heme chloroperoxidase